VFIESTRTEKQEEIPLKMELEFSIFIHHKTTSKIGMHNCALYRQARKGRKSINKNRK
jgi:hypothetical protein